MRETVFERGIGDPQVSYRTSAACNSPFAFLRRFLQYVTSFTITDPYNLQSLAGFQTMDKFNFLSGYTARHCRRTLVGDNTSRTTVG